jgi:hypothetical protein
MLGARVGGAPNTMNETPTSPASDVGAQTDNENVFDSPLDISKLKGHVNHGDASAGAADWYDDYLARDSGGAYQERKR